MASSKKCPMCGTSNDKNAQSCKYCGFLFEDFASSGIRTGSASTNPFPPPTQEQQPQSINAIPAPSVTDTFGMPTPITSIGAPLYTVSKSLLGSIVPSIVYLVFILFVTATTTFSLFSVAFITIFILISILPALFTSRKYEFFETSLRMHKIIGGDSEIPYTALEVRDYRAGRRPQIVLLAAGQKRPIVISGNPTNKELGLDLNQFLGKKLKRYIPEPRNQQHSTSSDDDSAMNNRDDDADAGYKP